MRVQTGTAVPAAGPMLRSAPFELLTTYRCVNLYDLFKSYLVIRLDISGTEWAVNERELQGLCQVSRRIFL